MLPAMDSDEASNSLVKTRIFILSDTHGMDFKSTSYLCQSADVAIHCGDLTDESKIDEFRRAIQAMKNLQAPLKLVIAGNHDFTLDVPVFKKKVADARLDSEPEHVSKEYSDYGEAKKLFDEARDAGVIFLEEGTSEFSLTNGATLNVYASPYTPSTSDWGFAYHPNQGHVFDIPMNTDLVITHGPPEGIMDRTSSGQRAGSRELFAAVSRARPRLHCFGHVHEGWGAKLVTWREKASESPSHLTDIDNDKSLVIGNLAKLTKSVYDSTESALEKATLKKKHTEQGCCQTSNSGGDKFSLETRTQTLFVNAAMKGDKDDQHFPWLVDVELPRVQTDNIICDTEISVSQDEHNKTTSQKRRSRSTDGEMGVNSTRAKTRKIN